MGSGRFSTPRLMKQTVFQEVTTASERRSRFGHMKRLPPAKHSALASILRRKLPDLNASVKRRSLHPSLADNRTFGTAQNLEFLPPSTSSGTHSHTDLGEATTSEALRGFGPRIKNPCDKRDYSQVECQNISSDEYVESMNIREGYDLDKEDHVEQDQDVYTSDNVGQLSATTRAEETAKAKTIITTRTLMSAATHSQTQSRPQDQRQLTRQPRRSSCKVATRTLKRCLFRRSGDHGSRRPAAFRCSYAHEHWTTLGRRKPKQGSALSGQRGRRLS